MPNRRTGFSGVPRRVPGVGIEPTPSWFRARRHYQQQLPRIVHWFETRFPMTSSLKSSGGRNRTCGLLVQSQASLPAATTPDHWLESALRESNPPRQLGRLAPLPLGQGHKSQSGRLDLNQRSRAPEARGLARLSHILMFKQSAQPELNRHIRPGKAAGCRYIMGASSIATKLSRIKSTGPDSNRRIRITSAES
jgi:hypothetical protein